MLKQLQAIVGADHVSDEPGACDLATSDIFEWPGRTPALMVAKPRHDGGNGRDPPCPAQTRRRGDPPRRRPVVHRRFRDGAGADRDRHHADERRRRPCGRSLRRRRRRRVVGECRRRAEAAWNEVGAGEPDLRRLFHGRGAGGSGHAGGPRRHSGADGGAVGRLGRAHRRADPLLPLRRDRTSPASSSAIAGPSASRPKS